jgi:hypothetical protein
MSLTSEQAKQLTIGQVLYHAFDKNADGTPAKWRVNGKVKTWVRNSNKVRIPIKHGLYAHGYLTETNLGFLSLTESEALA